MGFFSFLDKPFRTGRSAAEREQRRQAGLADERAQEAQDLSRELVELAKPTFQLGQQQLQDFTQTSTPGGLSGLLSEISGSGLTEGLERERMRGVEQFAAARGLRRSGSALREAAKVPTDVLFGLVDRITGNRLRGAQVGLGQGGNIQGGIAGLTTPMTATGTQTMSQAGTKAGILGSLLGNAGNIAGILGGVGSLFGLSDSRTKENIEKVGEFDNGVGIYTYNYVGDGRKAIGVIAQELEQYLPDAVREFHGLKHVNYEAIQ